MLHRLRRRLRRKHAPHPLAELPVPSDLPLYRFAAWPGEIRASVTGAALGSGGPVIRSAGVSHFGTEDQRLVVESNYPRSDYPDFYADRRRQALRLAAHAYVASLPDRTGQSPGRIVKEGERPWRTETVQVDGKPVDLEVMDLAPGIWAGITTLPGAIVTIEAQGVVRADLDLSLVRWRPAPD